MKGAFQEWQGPQGHQVIQDLWASLAMTVLRVKMGRRACQGTPGRRVKRVKQDHKASEVHQGREVDQVFQVVGVTTPRTHSPSLAL